MADQPQGSGTTVIGADTSIKGEMTVENKADIYGKFEGTITAKGHIHIADKSQCRATIDAATLLIDGAIEGNLSAGDKAQLSASAKVTGDLVASKLIVAEGAAFEGHVSVGPNAMKGGAPGGSAGGPKPPSAPTGGGDQGKK